MIVRQSVFVVPAVSRIAERKGCFARGGLQVVTTTVPSSRAQHADLAADRADIAITATDNLFAWDAAGSDIVLIGQIETTTDLALLLRPGLHSLDGLATVRLGVDAAANGFAVVAYAMMARLGRAGSADGAEQRERAPYEVVEVGGVIERFEALATGAVDATLVAPPLDEIGQRRGMSVAMRVQQLTPAYPGLGIVARRAALDAAAEPVAAYLAALDDALTWMRDADPGEVAAELAAAGFGPAAVRSVLATIPRALAPASDALSALVGLRQETGMAIAGAPEPADLIDLRPLRIAGLQP
jgi:ABC-type nitrate/sulfonate/bicarbonate transport system substrate-binding protein